MQETIDTLPEREILRYMGFRGEPDASLRSLVQKASALLLAAAEPRWIYVLSPAVQQPEGVFLTRLGLLLPGKNIKKLFTGCSAGALLGATLSTAADRLIDRLSLTDLSLAHAVDACAAAAVEELCDRAQAQIARETGHTFTPRFSPGFGDLPLQLQPELLAALQAGKNIGLSLTDSLLLTPRKSVTAVIGLRDPAPSNAGPHGGFAPG